MNVSEKAQANEMSALVSPLVSASSSSARLSADSSPSGYRFKPELISKQVVAGQASANNAVDTGERSIQNTESVSTPELAAVSNAPSLPRTQTQSSDGATQSTQSPTAKQDASGNWPVESRVEGGEITGTGNHQQEATLPPAPENSSARTVAASPLDRADAAPDQPMSGQDESGRTIDGSPAASSQIGNVHAVPATQEVATQPSVSRFAPDTSTPQQEAIPQQTATPQQTSTPPQAGMPQQTAPHQQTAMPPEPLSQTASHLASVDTGQATPADASTTPDNQSHISAPAAERMIMLPADLPIAATPANNQNGNQPASNVVDKTASSAIGSRTPIVAKTADATASKTTDAAGGSVDRPQHGEQNTPQSSQSSQADPAHVANPAASVSDRGESPAQAQTVPIQAAPLDAAATHRAPEVPDVATRSGGQPDVPASAHPEGEAVATNSINTAKLMQTMGESEMHVGMRSSEFGDISIRTSINEQQMVTRISLDHSELSQAISAHVSTMQTKLGSDFGLNTSIEVHDLGSSLSGQPGQSSQREHGAAPYSAQTGSNQAPREEESGVSPAVLANAGNGNRLDVRA
jgi:hypothetical protein